MGFRADTIKDINWLHEQQKELTEELYGLYGRLAKDFANRADEADALLIDTRADFIGLSDKVKDLTKRIDVVFGNLEHVVGQNAKDFTARLDELNYRICELEDPPVFTTEMGDPVERAAPTDRPLTATEINAAAAKFWAAFALPDHGLSKGVADDSHVADYEAFYEDQHETQYEENTTRGWCGECCESPEQEPALDCEFCGEESDTPEPLTPQAGDVWIENERYENGTYSCRRVTQVGGSTVETVMACERGPRRDHWTLSFLETHTLVWRDGQPVKAAHECTQACYVKAGA